MKKPHVSYRTVVGGVILVVTLCAIVVIYLIRSGRPPRYWRTHINCSHIAGLIGMYAGIDGTPPYAPTGSVREYSRQLASGTSYDIAGVSSMAQGIVYVNLAPNEWQRLIEFLSKDRQADGQVVIGWAAHPIIVRPPEFGDRVTYKHKIMYWFFNEDGWAAFPDRQDEFDKKLSALDKAIHETLGKSLADCLVYEEGKFDPSILKLPSVSSPAQNGPTQTRNESRPTEQNNSD